MTPRDADKLEEMADYAGRAVRSLADASLGEFVVDEKTLLAVERAVEIVGEAAAKVSPEARARLPALAWREMIGMRHVLAHGYAIVDHSVLYDVVRKHLPPLIVAIERLLAEEPPTP